MCGLGQNRSGASARNIPVPEQVFASTGPHGHRARMRGKLLANGPGALADYELLEMLLFLGIERRDTKPLAKATLNRFGGLAETLTASVDALAHLGTASVTILKLVEEAAARLSRAEVLDRPHLGNWDRLTEHLDNKRLDVPCRALFLNNRNRLLGDEAVPDGPVPQQAREVAGRALELHATAVILVCLTPKAKAGADTLALARLLSQASGLLAIQLHDCVVGGPGRWSSLRSAGSLR